MQIMIMIHGLLEKDVGIMKKMLLNQCLFLYLAIFSIN
nr:MAG TPA: hypothetical protein [Bacteriophage sp.]